MYISDVTYTYICVCTGSRHVVPDTEEICFYVAIFVSEISLKPYRVRWIRLVNLRLFSSPLALLYGDIAPLSMVVFSRSCSNTCEKYGTCMTNLGLATVHVINVYIYIYLYIYIRDFSHAAIAPLESPYKFIVPVQESCSHRAVLIIGSPT